MSSNEKEFAIQYLVLGGIIFPDHRVELRPGFLTDKTDFVKEPAESPLTADLIDDRGQLLIRYVVRASRICADARGQIPELIFSGKVPFPAASRILRLNWQERPIHEERISERVPEITLEWKPVTGLHGVTPIYWRGTHAEGKMLHYFLRYTNDDGKTWQPVSMLTAETKQEVNFDQLGGGPNCRLEVVATDGVKTNSDVSDVFTVPIKPCQAMILSPLDGTTCLAGQSVWLEGRGFYLEEQQPEMKDLYWQSSLDGDLGQGSALHANALSRGTHRLTLIAGAGDRAGQAHVSIEIIDPTGKTFAN